MKHILLIATGGTIASKYTKDGLSPAITAKELLTYIPAAGAFCRIETVQPFFLDSTNVGPDQWLILSDLIEKKYDHYDGFVICHGTDTMAYTAAALSYLVQNSRKPIVITGAQQSISKRDTDARENLRDAFLYASHDQACGVHIVFDHKVILGTRARKMRTKSYNAFESVDWPETAIIRNRIMITRPLKVYHKLDRRVMLHKLIPGEDGSLIDLMRSRTDAVIIESFGVGGLPNCTPAQGGTLPDAQAEGGTVCVPGEDAPVSYADAISRYIADGKQVIMATQVVHEGSDMSVYEVGKTMKSRFDLPESYDMTLEACVTKTMWALGQTKDADKFRELFYTPIGRDLLFSPLRP